MGQAVWKNIQILWIHTRESLPRRLLSIIETNITLKTLFLYTIDTRALSHILLHSENYRKPEALRFNLRKFLGPGVLLLFGFGHI
jgi:hypothetical protein